MTSDLKRRTFLANEKSSPRIYTCLASHGDDKLFGKWIDASLEVEVILEKIKQLLADSPIPNAQEFMIRDYEGFYCLKEFMVHRYRHCYSLKVDRHKALKEIHEKALFISEYGELGAKLLAYYGEIETAEKAMKYYYQGAYENELEYATYFFDEMHLESIPEPLRSYIDYKRFQRDIFIDDYFSIGVQGCCHVFERH